VPKLRVHNFSVSVDGYAAGPDQSLDNPLGVRGEELHNWFVVTRTFRKMSGERAAMRALMIVSPLPVRKAWARPSWAAICSDPSAANGPTTSGRAGGAMIRRTTIRRSSLRITRASRSRWRAEPSSTSSPTASKQPWSRHTRRPAGRTYGLPAAPPRSSTICARD
jgi:hypothetical protein